jgi:hypothetical protein
MNGLMVLKAIWVDDFLFIEEAEGKVVKTKRLCEGQHIRYGTNFLSHVTEQNPANATIIQCRGDAYSTVLLLDIVTNDFEVHTIVIKDENNLLKKK